jgi:hypothetical protein
MTNWIQISITVDGNIDTINMLDRENFSFEYIRPVPTLSDSGAELVFPFPPHCNSVDEADIYAEYMRQEFPNSFTTGKFLEELPDNTSLKWRMDHWGTISNLADNLQCQSNSLEGLPSFELERNDEDSISIDADTAWKPPIELLRFATERFPDLEIWLVYIDHWKGCAGKVRFKNGKIDEDESIIFNELRSILHDDSAWRDDSFLEILDGYGVRELIPHYLDDEESEEHELEEDYQEVA